MAIRCFRPGLISAPSLPAILRADPSVRRLRFILDNVLTEDLKLPGRARNQVLLFPKNIECVEDLCYERLEGVIAIRPRHRNVTFAKRCLEVPHSDSCDLHSEWSPDAVRSLPQVVNPYLFARREDIRCGSLGRSGWHGRCRNAHCFRLTPVRRHHPSKANSPDFVGYFFRHWKRLAEPIYPNVAVRCPPSPRFV